MKERIKELAEQAVCMTTIQIKIDKWSATDYSYLVNNELGQVSDDGKYYEFDNPENKFKMERYLRGEEL